MTALFCDVTGSTALGEELDPEVLHGVINRYFAEIRTTIERHGGTVEKFIGDAVMAVFGIPRVYEDDALRAVRAAAEIRDRLPAVAQEVGVTLRFRTGVNTGPVVMGEGENLAVGDAVNVAARLEQAASPGEILIGLETLRLVRDAVEVEPLEPLSLKGKSELLQAFRLVRVDPVAAGVARHLDAPLVGRERELRVLREAWEGAARESRCQLLTLLGVAGVGKSRLVTELLAGISEDAMVLSGRCLHYGEGITFWPLVDALTVLGDRAQGILERLGGGGAAMPQELFWEVRKFLEGLAAERPVVLYLDDLQWAEAMLLDLVDHVAELSRGAPIVLLCTARPELLDDRPGWGGGKLNATTLLLEPLAAGEATVLLDRLGGALDGDARARIVAASQGNPLFLEEMTALAAEQGTVTVPVTIQALLAARLERLGLEERELLERGAVEGEVFHRLAVRALADGAAAAQIDLWLAGLVRRELIRPHRGTVQGDEAFRFRHLLIRDAAYDALPKALRAELHARFAGWLEEHGEGLAELDEIAGWHLEQAAGYEQELGRAAAPELVRRAAEHLQAAGRRAAERGDGAAARNLLERALELTSDGDRLRTAVGLDLAEQLIDMGELARIDQLVSAGEHDPDLAAVATLTRLEWLVRSEPEGVTGRIAAELPRILAEFERRGDERGIARAHMVSFQGNWSRSLATPAAAEALLAAEHAHRAGDEGTRARALTWRLAALAIGERHTDEVAREAEAIAAEVSGPSALAWIDLVRGENQELHGRFDAARKLIERAIDALDSMGQVVLAAGAAQILARIEIIAGDPARARALLEQADRTLAEVGDRGYRSTTLALLADAAEQLGDADAARSAIELSEELSASEDVVNYAITNTVRARLALAERDHETAERMARRAVEFAYQTDFYRQRGQAHVILGHVLSARGRSNEAATAAQAAFTIFTAKGDQPRAAIARSLLETI